VLFGAIKGTVRELVEPDWFADILGFVGLFLAVIIPISFVAFRVGEAARQSSIGPLDRSLGFVYGVVRGLLIAAVAFIIFDTLAPKKPEWITDAKLIPIVQRSGDVLTSLFNSKQPRGVQTSADPKSPKAPSKPRWSEPAPEQQIAAVEPVPLPVEPEAPIDPPPPPKRSPKSAAESPPPPASEVGGLAPLLAPDPAPAKTQTAKPKPQPKSGFRSQPMEEAAPAPAKREAKSLGKAAKQAEKAKARAKVPKLDAKQTAKRPSEKRAPKTQIASSERRQKSKPAEDKAKTKGYGQRDRQALDQLVRSTTREP
ncbi:MAG: CvpA family protein, partial [Parvularculaceae bacterium]